MVSSEDLQNKLVVLSNSIEKKNWTYYFVEGLDNFIYYLDRIKSDSIKDKASNMINSCLNEIDSMDKYEESITHSYKYLYSTYIYYLADIYKSEFGFIKKPHHLFNALIIIVLFFIILAVSNFLFSLISMLVITISYYVYAILKIKKKKYY